MKELQNAPSERAVLAGFCQFGVESLIVCEYITPEHFFDSSNQKWCKVIQHALQTVEKCDLTSILSSATQLGIYADLNTAEEMGYLRSLFNYPVSQENIESHAIKLAKLKLGRDLERTLNDSKRKIREISGDESIDTIMAIAEAPIQELSAKVFCQSTGTELIGDDIEAYVEHLEENPVENFGIPTPFPILNALIGGGLRRGGFNLIGARLKQGKSFCGDEVALHIADKLETPALVLDTEMGKKDHKHRLLANLSGVDINDIETGKFAKDPDKRRKVKEAAKRLATIPYHYISIAGQPIENVLLIIQKWVRQHVGIDDNGITKDCVVIYDYFKLMDTGDLSKNMQEFQVLGFQATKLTNLCIKLDIACLAFIQLNRDGITKETTDIISQSDRIGWLCQSFTIFKEKSDEEKAADGPLCGNKKMVVVATRYGQGSQDGDYVNFKADFAKGKLTELTTRNQSKGKQKEFDDDEESTDFSTV